MVCFLVSVERPEMRRRKCKPPPLVTPVGRVVLRGEEGGGSREEPAVGNGSQNPGVNIGELSQS